jgi:hypothetical protein
LAEIKARKSMRDQGLEDSSDKLKLPLLTNHEDSHISPSEKPPQNLNGKTLISDPSHTDTLSKVFLKALTNTSRSAADFDLEYE